MNKKAIAILGAIFLLIVGTLGFLIYSKYSSKPSDSNTNNTVDNTNTDITDNGGENTDPNAIPDPFENGDTEPDPGSDTETLPQNSAFAKISDDNMVSPALFYNGKGITYFDAAGTLYQADITESAVGMALGNKRSLSIKIPGSFTSVIWPNSGDNFLVSYKDSQGNESYRAFNGGTREFNDLPTQITSADWAPSGTRILYVWHTGDKASLNEADPDTKNWRHIADMWETGNKIHVSPDGATIAFYQTTNSGANNKITLTTPDGKMWKDVTKEGYNYGVAWSPDSQKLIFAKMDKSSGKYQLWYYSLVSGEMKNLGLFTTAEKVAWSRDGQTIFAAVPFSGSPEGGALTQDSIYKMHTGSMEKVEYKPQDSQVIDARNLFLNISEDKLMFKNAQDGGLYYLDLTK